MNDKTKVANRVKSIDEEFDLIMLSDNEYFNDSIILLEQGFVLGMQRHGQL